MTGIEHEGIKVLGTCADVQWGRAFQLTDVPAESKASIKANFDWNDIMGIESVTVMKAEDLLNLSLVCSKTCRFDMYPIWCHL
jgi:hypothetical protein